MAGGGLANNCSAGGKVSPTTTDHTGAGAASTCDTGFASLRFIRSELHKNRKTWPRVPVAFGSLSNCGGRPERRSADNTG